MQTRDRAAGRRPEAAPPINLLWDPLAPWPRQLRDLPRRMVGLIRLAAAVHRTTLQLRDAPRPPGGLRCSPRITALQELAWDLAEPGVDADRAAARLRIHAGRSRSDLLWAAAQLRSWGPSVEAPRLERADRLLQQAARRRSRSAHPRVQPAPPARVQPAAQQRVQPAAPPRVQPAASGFSVVATR